MSQFPNVGAMPPMSIASYANPGSFAGVQLPPIQAPNFSGDLQGDQTQANAQNQQLYQQALNTQANAYNNQQGDIQQAIQQQQGYGQSQLSSLGQQLQQQLGANQQSNVSRGLSNTTLNQTSQAPIMQNYNQAVAGVNNQSANLMNGLYSNLATSQAQGANSLANLIASRTDQAPNAASFAQLNQQANSNPGMIQGSTFQAPTGGAGGQGGGMGAPIQNGAMPSISGSGAGGVAPSGQTYYQGSQANSAGNQFSSDGSLPNTSDSGGGQTITGGGGAATLYGQGETVPAPNVPGVTTGAFPPGSYNAPGMTMTPSQGYTGGTLGSGSGSGNVQGSGSQPSATGGSSPDYGSMGLGQLMQQQVAPAGTNTGPAAQQSSAPSSISAAMQPSSAPPSASSAPPSPGAAWMNPGNGQPGYWVNQSGTRI